MKTEIEMNGTPENLALRLIVARLLLEGAHRSETGPSRWLDVEEARLIDGLTVNTTSEASPVPEMLQVIRDVFHIARRQGGLTRESDKPGLVVTPLPAPPPE